MNAFKSIETAFLATTAAAITCAALLMPHSAAEATDKAEPMHVVVVSAKRMSAEEKLQSLREEQLAQSRQLVARG